MDLFRFFAFFLWIFTSKEYYPNPEYPSITGPSSKQRALEQAAPASKNTRPANLLLANQTVSSNFQTAQRIVENQECENSDGMAIHAWTQSRQQQGIIIAQWRPALIFIIKHAARLLRLILTVVVGSLGYALCAKLKRNRQAAPVDKVELREVLEAELEDVWEDAAISTDVKENGQAVPVDNVELREMLEVELTDLWDDAAIWSDSSDSDSDSDGSRITQIELKNDQALPEADSQLNPALPVATAELSETFEDDMEAICGDARKLTDSAAAQHIESDLTTEQTVDTLLYGTDGIPYLVRFTVLPEEAL
ncbi:uncharacterized protein LOC108605013 [Drosophila busckii]|uniref:uncharacterized protein LOC108605013 n=1 Tax=Drosophila busckii TaxID=30019 RepID=UPI00083F16D0|nr:uncharacterized protein LOC108605013 [Drosophila busckii]